MQRTRLSTSLTRRILCESLSFSLLSLLSASDFCERRNPSHDYIFWAEGSKLEIAAYALALLGREMGVTRIASHWKSWRSSRRSEARAAWARDGRGGEERNHRGARGALPSGISHQGLYVDHLLSPTLATLMSWRAIGNPTGASSCVRARACVRVRVDFRTRTI
jgi:hypothetical protein